MRKAILAGALGILMGAGLLAVQPANAYMGDACGGANEVACLDDLGLPGFEGGALLVGTGGSGRLCVPVVGAVANPLPGVYVVLDGNNSNTANLSGYMGISTAETGATEDCAQGNNGSGTNSGGSFGSDLVPGVQLPLPFACGFTSGPNFESTGRDGCYIP